MPVSENRVIAGMDHSGWPTLNAAMNRSPHMAIIAIVSNWMKGLLHSDLIEGSSPCDRPGAVARLGIAGSSFG
jgi:hypothetical protein